MKKYKKLLMVAPLACMLGTGVVTVPSTTAHAAVAQDQFRQGDYYTKDNLAQTIFLRYKRSIEGNPELRTKFKLAANEEIAAAFNQEIDDMKAQFKTSELSANGNSFDVTSQVDSYEDAGFTNLVTINNDDGIEKQTAVTPEVTEKYTETNTYTNQEGIKLGGEFTSKLTVKVPGDVLAAEWGFKLSSEFSYTRTDTNTKTNEKMITFKSQSVVAAPGGTTTYYGTVRKAKFSGSFTSDAYITNLKKLRVPVRNKDTGAIRYQEADLTSADMYYIFKTSGIPLPSYLKLDDLNKKVIVNNTRFDFSGEGGYYSTIKVRFIPKGKKSGKTMSYSAYKEAAEKGAL
ncbi:ETX/MTX2 family pore-forming toxin (plasmid) [Bacillus bombysepticus]